MGGGKLDDGGFLLLVRRRVHRGVVELDLGHLAHVDRIGQQPVFDILHVLGHASDQLFIKIAHVEIASGFGQQAAQELHQLL